MPFILNPENLLIKGRRGDSGSFIFKFKENLSPFCIHFCVKKNINDPDSKALISKEYSNINSNELTVALTADDTIKLTAPNGNYGTYYWGLKIHTGSEYVQTIIPTEFNKPPLMHIYPSIGGIE